jgi:hypothetical protein
MLLYLAGVNEHTVLRIVGSKRWSVAHFRRTIQYLLEYGVASEQLDAIVRTVKAYAAGKNGITSLFADNWPSRASVKVILFWNPQRTRQTGCGSLLVAQSEQRIHA